MKCDQATNLLRLYLAGELDAVTRERVEAHLRQCEACAAERSRARAFDDLLKHRPVLAPPAGFAARVVARAKAEESSTAAASVGGWQAYFERWVFSYDWGLKASAAAALILVAIAGFEIGQATLVKSRQLAKPSRNGAANRVEIVFAEAATLELMLRASYSDAGDEDKPSGGQQ